ncbi:MAG: hypothetical protein ABI472_23765 [Ginsengibacter sp.]
MMITIDKNTSKKVPPFLLSQKREFFAFNNYKQAFIASMVLMKAFSFLMSFFQASSLSKRSISFLMVNAALPASIPKLSTFSEIATDLVISYDTSPKKRELVKLSYPPESQEEIGGYYINLKLVYTDLHPTSSNNTHAAKRKLKVKG